MDTSLRLLRYAAAVADHGSFTSAAGALYVSQPALSRQVRQLEQQLKIRLFQRTSHGVSLTTSGKTFLDAARTVLDDFDRAVSQARLAEKAYQSVLRVGINVASPDRLAAELRVAFTAKHPEVRVRPKTVDWGDEAAALREGVVDVAFLWPPTDTRGLALVNVGRETRVVGLAKGHPLSARPALTLDDVRKEPLIWLNRGSRAWVDWWAVNPRQDGSAPFWGEEADSIEEALEYVAAGDGIFFAPASLRTRSYRDDIAWLPLSDADHACVAVGCSASNDKPETAAFMRLVVKRRQTSFAASWPPDSDPTCRTASDQEREALLRTA